ncbi:MAG: bifunctional diaminohydroxyphosphoribosylaminopyrimidine deaminase/5-amino-6-(5-phosphoribosylamino)uracil reductase RibD [Candidatus Omnitrophota bacterium]
MLYDKHIAFMKLAKALALKGLGRTSPNPIVGCVLVKNGKIVAKGYHRKAGCAHAEIEALNDAKKKHIDLTNVTMYVSLEPCCHFGKTPPCTDAIVKNGIKRIVIGMKDPNPLNNGKGIAVLKKAGINVTLGILEDELRKINLPFIKFIQKQLPYVAVKIAASLDGKIATKTGDSKWITNEYSRSFVHRLRGSADAILVGRATILRDDPLLDCRAKERILLKQPIKIVLDEKLKIPLSSNIFSSNSPARTIIATTKKASYKRATYFTRLTNVELLYCRAKSGVIDLKDLMKKLAQKGMLYILVEGGGTTIASFFKERLVDELYLFISPKIIGGKNAPTPVEGSGIKKIKDALIVNNVTVKRFNNDVLIHAFV